MAKFPACFGFLDQKRCSYCKHFEPCHEKYYNKMAVQRITAPHKVK